MNVPEGILCNQTHEWVLEQNDVVTVGITDIGIKKLGEVVFVELPEISSKYSKGEVFATIETVRMASELYMPISGEIVEINEELINSPELINEDAFEYWLVKIKPDDYNNDSQNLSEYDDYSEENY